MQILYGFSNSVNCKINIFIGLFDVLVLFIKLILKGIIMKYVVMLCCVMSLFIIPSYCSDLNETFIEVKSFDGSSESESTMESSESEYTEVSQDAELYTDSLEVQSTEDSPEAESSEVSPEVESSMDSFDIESSDLTPIEDVQEN